MHGALRTLRRPRIEHTEEFVFQDDLVDVRIDVDRIAWRLCMAGADETDAERRCKPKVTFHEHSSLGSHPIPGAVR